MGEPTRGAAREGGTRAHRAARGHPARATAPGAAPQRWRRRNRLLSTRRPAPELLDHRRVDLDRLRATLGGIQGDGTTATGLHLAVARPPTRSRSTPH